VQLPRSLRGRLRRRSGPERAAPEYDLASSLDEDQRSILAEVRPYTMTSVERQVALLDAVDHVHRHGVTGAFVECGVWRGGSVLSMIRRLQQLDAAPRDLYLYDTFEGMTRPTEEDTSDFDDEALTTWTSATSRPWEELFGEHAFDERSVRELLSGSSYPSSHVHVVVGDVEHTIPETVPEEIAILRLDTDWYQSTRHEMEHLYPRLAVGGVLIVDDYGHWKGSRQAVDEYFTQHPRPLLLAVDYTCRVGVKVDV
jgi:O-methyltransferase